MYATAKSGRPVYQMMNIMGLSDSVMPDRYNSRRFKSDNCSR